MTSLPHGSRLALYMQGEMTHQAGKLGRGVLRYSHSEIVCVVDSVNAGRDASDVVGIPRSVPVVASLAEAHAMGANVLVLGIAPGGGLIPASWRPMLSEAIERGFSLVNGLHDRAAPLFPSLPHGQWVWDVRGEPSGLATSQGLSRLMLEPRVLMVGSDMSVGKMTTALEMDRCAQERGLRSAFVATGQTGIIISGSGIPLDSIRVDFAPGAVEGEVLRHAGADVIFVEGQGSLFHPFSSATLALMRGSAPTHLIFCHRAGMVTNPLLPWVQVPPVAQMVMLNEDLAAGLGAFVRPVTSGVALNTFGLTDDEAQAACEAIQEETGLPCCDPVRHGAHRLVESLGLTSKAP
jgi:uncharacterized NAD-dependent epimerase/dehydratase family protein